MDPGETQTSEPEDKKGNENAQVCVIKEIAQKDYICQGKTEEDSSALTIV